MEPRPLPAFYCVYLLRSIPRPASLYVGSTPHPARRLAQHNGRVSGGADRTSRHAWRPWRAACLVAGFPSAVAALQFEWAWRHAHLTRFIRDDDRVVRATRGPGRVSKKTGRTVHRPRKTCEGLPEKVRELRLLAGGAGFGRLGLEVRVFDEEVWKLWAEAEDEGQPLGGARIPVIEDFEEGQQARRKGVAHEELEREHMERVRRIDHTYAPLRDHLLKALGRLEAGETVSCSVCKDPILPPGHMAIFCQNAECSMTAHISCLARTFLQAESQPSAVLPVRGQCPECQTELRWSGLVREMTLRARDAKQVVKLRKKPRKRKNPPELLSSPSRATETKDDNEDLADEAEWLRIEDVIDEPRMNEVQDDDDASSVTSMDSDASAPTASARPRVQMPPAFDPIAEVADSDADSDIEILN